MKRLILLFTFLTAFTVTSFSAHKFYVGMFIIKHAPEKEMLQITMRLFLDDINNALTEKSGRTFYLGEKDESTQDVEGLNKYLKENFVLTVDGKVKQLEYMSHEIENNVLVCYLRI